jgi:hypothetical protein
MALPNHRICVVKSNMHTIYNFDLNNPNMTLGQMIQHVFEEPNYDFAGSTTPNANDVAIRFLPNDSDPKMYLTDGRRLFEEYSRVSVQVNNQTVNLIVFFDYITKQIVVVFDFDPAVINENDPEFQALLECIKTINMFIQNSNGGVFKISHDTHTMFGKLKTHDIKTKHLVECYEILLNGLVDTGPNIITNGTFEGELHITIECYQALKDARKRRFRGGCVDLNILFIVSIIVIIIVVVIITICVLNHESFSTVNLN